MVATAPDAARAPTLGQEVRRVWSDGRRRGQRTLTALGVAVVVVGVFLRFYAPSAFWLDEAISVNIAKLPLSQLHGALRQDGAPPLYYVLLHFWMLVLGRSDVAIRALGGVASVTALPFFWAAGRRLGGTRVAWITFFLAVTSPFAIFYATDARMYSFMILWCLLGFLALARALERPSAGRLVALGLLSAVTLYTHYWGLYLVTMTGLWLLYQL
ncbi:MAG: glycosyltransferase family 39 protein, partial [Acidimicrobiales bacterium]